MDTLLQELLIARGPCGQEDEVRTLLQGLLKDLVDETWIDPAGNLIGKIKGKSASKPPIRLMAHMDELSMIVKRINEDGSLRVDPLGGLLPGSLGQGPVEILGNGKIIPGILSFGSMHSTAETAVPNKMMPESDQGQSKALSWQDVYVITRLSPQELLQAGVHAGSRVVIARCKRNLFYVQDCIGGYFLDNRASIAACLMALKLLAEPPPQDIYFVASASEEIGGVGASYAARTLPGDLTLAIDVGPVAKEYQTTLSADPIIVYQDSFCLYDLKTNEHLLKLAKANNIPVQTALWANYGSDASLAQIRGQSAQSALLCFPVENTHGFEIMHKDCLTRLSRLLAAFLMDEGA